MEGCNVDLDNASEGDFDSQEVIYDIELTGNEEDVNISLGDDFTIENSLMDEIAAETENTPTVETGSINNDDKTEEIKQDTNFESKDEPTTDLTETDHSVVPDDLFGFGSSSTNSLNDEFDIFGGISDDGNSLSYEDPFASNSFVSVGYEDEFGFQTTHADTTETENELESATVPADVLVVDVEDSPPISVEEPELEPEPEPEPTEIENNAQEESPPEEPQHNKESPEASTEETKEREQEDKGVIDVIPSDLFGDSEPSIFDTLCEESETMGADTANDFDFFGSPDANQSEFSIGYEDPFGSNSFGSGVTLEPASTGAYDPFGFDEPQPVSSVYPENERTSVSPPPVPSYPMESDQIRSISAPQVLETPTFAPGITNPVLSPISFQWGEESSFSTIPVNENQGDESGNELDRRPHAIASFGFGGKLFVFPNSPNSTKINSYSLKTLAAPTSYFKELNSYPGPLSSNSSKSKIISFLQAKVKRIRDDINVTPDETMLWELLHVLLTEGDATGFINNEQMRNKIISLLTQNEDEWLGGSNSNKIQKETEFIDHYNKESILQNIQSKLESGEQLEAYNLALNNQLYEHALIIGTLLGSRYYSDAVSKFVDDNLMQECSLRSIYKLCAADQGDSASSLGIDQTQLAQKWKKHISLLMSGSNQTWQSTVGRIGDALWQKHNNVAAAHFCYILAGTKFQEASQATARIALIGGDHKRTTTFVRISTIEYSEILEYIQLLTNPKNRALSLLRYKLVLAAWMSDFGLIDKTKNYLKNIQQIVKQFGQQNIDQKLFRSLQGFHDRIQKSEEGESSTWNLFGKIVTKIVGTEDSGPAPIKTSLPATTTKPSNSVPQVQPFMHAAPNPNPNPHTNPIMNPMGVPSPLSVSQPQTSLPQSSQAPGTPYDVFDSFDSQPKEQHKPQQSKPQQPEPPKQSTEDNEPEDEDGKSNKEQGKSGGGILSWFSFSSFIPKKPKSMDLGQQASMVYSKKHSMWIPAGVDEDEYAASKKKTTAPPPPMSLSQPVMNQFPSAAVDQSPNVQASAPTSPGMSAPAPAPSTPGSNLIAPRASSSRLRNLHRARGSSPAVASSPPVSRKFTVFTPTAVPDSGGESSYKSAFEEVGGDVIIPDALTSSDEPEKQ